MSLRKKIDVDMRDPKALAAGIVKLEADNRELRDGQACMENQISNYRETMTIANRNLCELIRRSNNQPVPEMELEKLRFVARGESLMMHALFLEMSLIKKRFPDVCECITEEMPSPLAVEQLVEATRRSLQRAEDTQKKCDALREESKRLKKEYDDIYASRVEEYLMRQFKRELVGSKTNINEFPMGPMFASDMEDEDEMDAAERAAKAPEAPEANAPVAKVNQGLEGLAVESSKTKNRKDHKGRGVRE